MIKSMTGFGKISKSYDNFDIIVEIKSVNSKYFDTSFRLPKQLSSLEIFLRSYSQEKLVRGKIDIKIEFISKNSIKTPKINEDLIIHYKNILENICTLTNIEKNITLENYLKLPDIIDFSPNNEIEMELYNNAKDVVSICINEVDSMRIKEGKSLEKDIINRLDNISKFLNEIQKFSSNIFDYWRNKFIKRLQELDVVNINEEKIIQEASLYAEKADITEEITRANCHINHFKNIIENEFPNGKKLDFLCQELNREFNTIASKSFKSEIIKYVIEGKSEIDRIREQVQNIV